MFAQNIQSIADLVARREARLSRSQRTIEAVTQAIGRPLLLYANLIFIVVWILGNSHLLTQHPWDSPPFFWLTTVLAVESILVAGMVLITQNRQGQEAERRAQLDLQINLLSEQKITKILSILQEIAHLRDLDHKNDPELQAMQETADPEVLLTALEFAMDQATKDADLTADFGTGAPNANVVEALKEAEQEVADARSKTP